MRLVQLCMIIVFSGSVSGQNLNKGFEALAMYDYFQAKKIFEKKEKKSPSIAAFGLSVIYLRDDNPFHNLDSAYVKIVKSERKYKEEKEKTREKYAEKWKYTYDSILVLRQAVSSEMFKNVESENTELAYVRFIAAHPWAKELKQAKYSRDLLAFEKAEQSNTSHDYAHFLEKYPKSEFANLAKELFFRSQYAEQVESGTEEAFADFVTHYSYNPYVSEAEKELYKVATSDHTVLEYKRFIRKYPDNPHIEEAWQLLYRAYTRDFSLAKVEQFKKEFPDYPFMEELEREIYALNRLLLPYRKNGKWGYIDREGTVIIRPGFDGASLFNEGMAVVQLNGALGYIDALGDKIVEPIFADASAFKDGIAIVADEDDYYGIIDRTGLMILETDFEEIGEPSEGLFYVLTDEGYVFYDQSGKRAFQGVFDQVEAFEEGTAVVIQNEKYLVIDKQGRVVLEREEKITRFGSGFLFGNEDSTFIVALSGDTLFSGEAVRFGPQTGTYIPYVEQDKVGFVNENGEIKIEPQFANYPNVLLFGQFKNGYAKMLDERSGKYGLIDTTGQWKVAPRYQDISYYSDIFAAKRNEYWEFFDSGMNRVWNRRFALAESFSGPTAVVMDENRYGLFGRKGEFVLPPEYDEIIEVTSDLLRIHDDNGFRIYDKSGKLKLPHAYSRVELILPGILRLFREDKMEYYLIENDCIIEPVE